MSSPRKSSPAVGIVVSILIIGAIASLGYYQFGIAAKETTTTTSSTSFSCTPSTCSNVTLLSGAASCNPAPCGFGPLSITVVIGKNNSVFWDNKDNAPHTVTGGNATQWSAGTAQLTDLGTSGGSGNMNAGDVYGVAFTRAGTYSYACSYHPWMRATIIVKAG